MTDRIKGLVVTLKEDYRDDDLDPMISDRKNDPYWIAHERACLIVETWPDWKLKSEGIERRGKTEGRWWRITECPCCGHKKVVRKDG